MPGRIVFCRVVLLCLLVAACASASAAASVVRTFTFSPADLQIASDPRGYVHYSIEGGAAWGDPGTPELPGLSALIDLPAGERAVSVRATASDFVTVTGGKPYPAQTPTPSGRTATWTGPDAARYAAGDWTPTDAAVLGPSGALRGRALGSVVLLPLQLRPATGEARLATRIEVEITTAPESEPLVRRRVVPEWEQAMDEGFGAVMAHGPAAVRQGLDPGRRWSGAAVGRQVGGLSADATGALRPQAATALPSVDGSPVEYLIITSEAMKSTLQPLADWKTEQGQPAAVRTVEFIDQNYPFGVDRADRIRRFIRDAYTQWGTLWVMLAGDTPVIPVRYARTTFFGGVDLASDLYYSDLDGNWDADGDSLFGEGYLDASTPGDNVDLYPDVYVARAPIETVSQAQVFVTKQLQYQTNPATGYLCKALFFAEVLFPQGWQPGQTIASDGATIAEHAVAKLTGCMTPTKLYENYTAYPGSILETKRAVIDSMNAGFNILHHVGHGYRNTMSVGDSSMTNVDIVGLHNGSKITGLVYAINCTSAAIDFESIGEEFLIAPNGGAINNVGSTNYDFPATGDGYQNEFYDLVFNQGVTRIGEAAALQKLPFVAFANFDNVQRWTQMSMLLLGEPSSRLWTAEPTPLSVVYPASVTLRDTTVTVTVQKGGFGVAGAVVCLSKSGEDYRVGVSDVDGQVTLPFHFETTGTAKLTVTSVNARPYRGTLNVTAASQVVLVARAQDRVVTDTGAGNVGNGNGVLDAGETVQLTLPVRNVGGTASGSATATLLSVDSRVTVLSATGTYGTIAAGGSANGTAYRIQVARSGVRDGDELHLRLAINDGLGGQYREEQYLTVRAPDVRLYQRLLSDGGTGNGDQFLDIGETANYTLTLINVQEGAARGVTATLAAFSPGVAVIDGTSSFGDIASKAQAVGDVFRIQNLSDADPRFLLTVSDAYGPLFTQVIDFGLPAAPASALGSGSASAIALVWTKSSANDLLGYNIYRATSPGGPYAKRNFVAGDRIAQYQDEGLASLTRYYYYVTAVDSSANESAPSATVSASTNPPMLAGFPIPMGRTTPSSPVVGDVDHDGRLEAFVGSDYLYAWHADGSGVVDADGSERTSGDFTNQGSYYASAPALADLDNDGVTDIIALSWETQQLFVFEPDGSMKPGFPVTLQDPVWSSPAIGDIDGDGKKEIVFNSNGPRVYAFRWDGTEERDGDANPATLGVFATVPSSYNFGSPALADLDHDGKLDIIAPEADGRLYAWRWNGTAVPGWPWGPYAAFNSSPAVGDIDNDGKLEIAVQCTNDRLVCVKENGVNEPGFPVICPSSGNSRSPSPALVDVDGDGLREILCAASDGTLRLFRYNAAAYPGWTGGVRFTTKTSAATESSPVAADLNGDGVLDFLIGSEDGQLYGLRSDGTPLAGFPIRLDGEVRGTPVICDFDQNGTAEILLAGWDKNMYAWTYPGVYTPNPARDWAMFRHDADRSGRLGPAVVIGVEQQVAVQSVEAIDGGILLHWKLPADAVAEGGAWRAYRIDGADGSAPAAEGRLTALPDGYAAVGAGAVATSPDGWIAVEDRTVIPGHSYSYVLARVEAAPGTAPLAFGPYGVVASGEAPALAYLAPAFPNPGGGAQTLAFGLPADVAPGAVVRLDFYDVRGARVRTLVNRRAAAGRYVVTWDGRSDDGRSAPPGVYLYRLTAGRISLGGRLVRVGR